MKSTGWLSVFIIVGVLTALAIGFSSQFARYTVAYDDEQQGLQQQIIIKFSFVVAENTPKGIAARHFAQLVQQKTSGRVKVELFPDGSLYNEPDEMDALRSGNVHMIAPSFSNLSEVFPEWMVMDLPYLFADEKAVEEAFQGAIGEMLFKPLPSKGLIGLGLWGNGFQQLTSNLRPIIHPRDFKNVTFRILPSKVTETRFRLLGSKTIPIPFNQVYKSMEAGIVDGGEYTISNIYSRKFYQVQKYLTISNHTYLGYAVLMNKAFWDQLPDDIQTSIQEAMQETNAFARQNAIAMNNEQEMLLRRTGKMTIHTLTKEESAEWKQALEPAYQLNESSIGKPLMDAVRKLRNNDNTPS